MSAIGVHFGCTSACVAIIKDGRADVVANDAGDRVTPAVVAYRDDEQVVGIAAKLGRTRNSANTVVKVKQLLGRRFDDPETQVYKSQSKCQVVSRQGEPHYEMVVGEKPELVAPVEAARAILHKMRETAQSALGSDVDSAVLTVPFDFSPSACEALRAAAEAAGFRVLRLIHEPAAALLAYGIGQEAPAGRSHVLVYKLGGTSLSITLLQVNSGMFRVLNSHTDQQVGGESFTEALAHFLATEFERTFRCPGVRSNSRAMLKLMSGADQAKHSLSSLGSANCFVDSLHDGMDFECNVSRARFELLCTPIFNRCIQPIRALLEKAGLSTGDVNKVVLCGGSTKIPRLQALIRDLFPDVEVLSSIPPDEVIAVGAALQAGLLVSKDDLDLDLESQATTVEVSAKDILLKEVDESGAEVLTVLLPCGTPLPARIQRLLSGDGRLSSLRMDLYQRGGAEEPQQLARVVLKDLQPQEEKHNIDTVLTMKRDGSLQFSYVERDHGRPQLLTIGSTAP